MAYQSGSVNLNYNINPNLELTQAWDNDDFIKELGDVADTYREIDEDKIKTYRDAQAKLLDKASTVGLDDNDLSGIHDELIKPLKDELDKLAEYDSETLAQLDFENPYGGIGNRNVDRIKQMNGLQEKITVAKFRTKRYNDYRTAIQNTVNDTPENQEKARKYLIGEVDDLELNYPPDINVNEMVEEQRQRALVRIQEMYPESISTIVTADPNNPLYETEVTTLKASKEVADRIFNEWETSSGKQGQQTQTQKDSSGNVVTTTVDKTSVDRNADGYIRSQQKNVEMPIYGFNENGDFVVLATKRIGDMTDREYFDAMYLPAIFGKTGVNSITKKTYNEDRGKANQAQADINVTNAKKRNIDGDTKNQEKETDANVGLTKAQSNQINKQTRLLSNGKNEGSVDNSEYNTLKRALTDGIKNRDTRILKSGLKGSILANLPNAPKDNSSLAKVPIFSQTRKVGEETQVVQVFYDDETGMYNIDIDGTEITSPTMDGVILEISQNKVYDKTATSESSNSSTTSNKKVSDEELRKLLQ